MKKVCGLEQFSLGPISYKVKNVALSGALSCVSPSSKTLVFEIFLVYTKCEDFSMIVHVETILPIKGKLATPKSNLLFQITLHLILNF